MAETEPRSPFPIFFWLLVVVLVAAVAVMGYFAFERIPPAPPPRPVPVGPAGGGSGSGGGAPPTLDPGLPVVVIPRDLSPLLSPALQVVGSWPEEATLRPEDVPAGGALPEAAASLLAEAQGLLAPSLIPPDVTRAFGRDRDGNLYLRLGRGEGPRGLCRQLFVGNDPAFQVPTFSAEIACAPAAGPLTLAVLRARARDVVAEPVARELDQEEYALQANPQPEVTTATGFAAIATLDRGGIGQVYPWLQAFASADRLLLVFNGTPGESHAPPPPR